MAQELVVSLTKTWRLEKQKVTKLAVLLGVSLDASLAFSSVLSSVLAKVELLVRQLDSLRATKSGSEMVMRSGSLKAMKSVSSWASWKEAVLSCLEQLCW